MIGSRLTTRAVYLFGALLILVGLIFISTGVPVVRLEIGWTEIIGGAVAASAGCVIVVLGVFLARLEVLQETLDRLALPVPSAGPYAEPVDAYDAPEPIPAPFAPVDAEQIPAPEPDREEIAARFPAVHPLAPAARRERLEQGDTDVRPEPALAIPALDPADDAPPVVEPPEAPALTESAPALVHAEEVASQSPAVEPFQAAIASEAGKARPSFMSSILSRRLMAGAPRRAPDPTGAGPPIPLTPADDAFASQPLRRSVVDLSSGWQEEEEPRAPVPPPEPPPHEDPIPLAADAVAPPPHVEAAAPDVPDGPADAPPAPEPGPAQPVVVGRYNAGSASYVMYSNGMIEVETEQGTHQFASMQELKAFIERRDTANAY